VVIVVLVVVVVVNNTGNSSVFKTDPPRKLVKYGTSIKYVGNSIERESCSRNVPVFEGLESKETANNPPRETLDTDLADTSPSDTLCLDSNALWITLTAICA